MVARFPTKAKIKRDASSGKKEVEVKSVIERNERRTPAAQKKFWNLILERSRWALTVRNEKESWNFGVIEGEG